MALDTTIGGTDADSYGTLAAYETYAAGNGWTLAETDEANEANLRRAAQGMDRKSRFLGIQQYQFQARAWPRLVNDLVRDWPINPDTIPLDVIHAQFEWAYILQGGVDPLATITSGTTSEMIKVGPITIDEETLPTAPPRLIAVDGLLRPYLKSGAGQIALVRG